ncbi:flavin reductase family protein [Ramlibacter sp.]|uniref:flavin reductase family protein n=1 Tax=Ramlibacter sp. TaxID=1917967 RepID=UPI003D138592
MTQTVETQEGDALFMAAADFPKTMLNAIVAPRPIGWMSTLSAAGEVNLAPFSFFNAICVTTPMLMFACNPPADRATKDTLRNVRETGEFVYNLVAYDLRDRMNRTSAPLPTGQDEFEFAGLRKAPSQVVRPPRVADAPANIECRVVQIVDLDPDATGKTVSTVIIGRVVGVHVRREFLDEKGRFDSKAANPLLRLGGEIYGTLGSLLDIPRPAYP